MGSWRFYRRLRVFPGVTINFSKSGPSVSAGVRGAHMTFGRRGVRRTVGIPGTGIYYTSTRSYAPAMGRALGDSPINSLAGTQRTAFDGASSLALSALFFAFVLAVIAYLTMGEQAALVVAGGCLLGSLLALRLYKIFGGGSKNDPDKFSP